MISRRTFSSGSFAAVDCKKDLGAILIGEPTGGNPNSYGEQKSFKLPNSGVHVFYSIKYFSLLDTEEDYIKPDIEIDYLSREYLQGKDPVLDYVMKN